MKKRVRSYEHEGFVVDFSPSRCIHAEECVRGLPEVFDTSKRPWVDPAQAEAAAIVDVVEKCPTGALQFRFTGGQRQELPDAEATINIVPAGPLYARGDITVNETDGRVERETRVALCRCGASENKPWCDNTHLDMGFDDAGDVSESKLAPVDGPVSTGLTVTQAPNGPLLIEGEVTIVSSTGERLTGGRGALCRCGASSNKPFCDGSHNRVGFEAS